MEINEQKRCLCQCRNKNCNHVFDFCEKQLYRFNNIDRFVCPKCKHEFVITSLANEKDSNYLDVLSSMYSE